VTCKGAGDDVPAINAAIAAAKSTPADKVTGIRGAIQLSGTCFVGQSSTILINVDGIVLKGPATLVCQGSNLRPNNKPVIQVGSLVFTLFQLFG
jgi:hypothetical protein